MMLNKLRNENNFTQLYMAQQLGVAQNTYSQYERKLRQPDFNLVPKLARILGCTIEDIVLCFCDEEVKAG